MSEWISVEDRLPEIRDASVLAYWKHGGIDMVHIEEYFSDITSGITHWMPLPNPPVAS